MSGDFNPYEQQGQPAPSGGGYQGGGNGGGYRPQNNGGYNNRGGGGYGGNRSYSGGGNRSYSGGGGNGGYGGNKQGGQGFQKREYTPEDIKAASFPLSVVICGNENINDLVAQKISRVAQAYSAKGFKVRTKGLNGTGDVVCNSISDPEIHIPFKNFNKRTPGPTGSQYTNEICTELARRQMPDLDNLQGVSKAIFSATPRVVLGKYLTAPAQMVIIWSEDGAESAHEVTSRTGNAGHTLKVAQASGIRVINLQRPDGEQRALAYLETFNVQQEPQQQPGQQPTGQPAVQHQPGHQPSQPGNHAPGFSTGPGGTHYAGTAEQPAGQHQHAGVQPGHQQQQQPTNHAGTGYPGNPQNSGGSFSY